MINNISCIFTEIKVNGQKLEVSGISYNWRGLQAWDTLQNSTDNSSIDKVETRKRQEYFSQFQDTTDVFPCYTHLPVWLWIMDPLKRAPKKNTSHGNEVLPQDTMHLIQRPCYQRGSPCEDPAHEDLQTIVRDTNCSGMDMSPVHQVWPKPSCKSRWKGEEDKADRERGGKTILGNIQALSSLSPRGLWRTGKNGGNWLWNHLWCPNDPRG